MDQLSWKNAENMRIEALHWPLENPRAVIALVHGQGEHVGRYDHVARWFQQKGMAFIGHDQQGYGKSAGKRGHAAGLDPLLNDIGQLLERAAAIYPDTPIFLYGHSMGGNLALNYVLRRKPALRGLVATGPWIRLTTEAPALKVWLGRLMKRLFPSLALPNDLDVNGLSRDKAVVKAYQDDPLVHDKISAAAGIELLDAANWLDQYSGPISMPALLMHGGADPITSAPATRALAARLQGDVAHREWDGLYHEIHNEPEQADVFAHTLAWMERVLEK